MNAIPGTNIEATRILLKLLLPPLFILFFLGFDKVDTIHSVLFGIEMNCTRLPYDTIFKQKGDTLLVNSFHGTRLERDLVFGPPSFIVRCGPADFGIIQDGTTFQQGRTVVVLVVRRGSSSMCVLLCKLAQPVGSLPAFLRSRFQEPAFYLRVQEYEHLPCEQQYCTVYRNLPVPFFLKR